MSMELIEVEFQVDKPNGDIDFITVYDLPESVAKGWVINKYPGCHVSAFTPPPEIYQTKKD